MEPSQIISRAEIDDAYDKLHAEHERLKQTHDFDAKRLRVLAKVAGCEDGVPDDATAVACAGTVLGMIRYNVEKIVAERDRLTAALAAEQSETANLRAATRGVTCYHSDEQVNAELGRLRDEIAMLRTDNDRLTSALAEEKAFSRRLAEDLEHHEGRAERLEWELDQRKKTAAYNAEPADKATAQYESALAQKVEEVAMLKDTLQAYNLRTCPSCQYHIDGAAELQQQLQAANSRAERLRDALEKLAKEYKPFNMSIISLMGKIAFDALAADKEGV